MRLQVPPEARFARTVRSAVVGFAAFHHIAGNDLDDLLIALGEALANAFAHSESQRDIEIICRLDDTQLVVKVIDAGIGYESIPKGDVMLPGPLAQRGRGIALMQHFTDIFAIDPLPGNGTVVTLGRYR